MLLQVLKRAMWWRNAKLMAILGSIFVVLLFIIIASRCVIQPLKTKP